MTQPQPDPLPALVAHLRSWVAQHADVIEAPTVMARPPRDIFFAARYRRTRDWEARTLKREPSALEKAVFADPEIPRHLNLCITLAGPGYRHDPDAIPIDFPGAASFLADRMRTADELRAELVRVTAERDAALDQVAAFQRNRDMRSQWARDALMNNTGVRRP